MLRRRLPAALPERTAWQPLQAAWRALPIPSGAQRLLLLLSWSPLALAVVASPIGLLTPSLPLWLALAPLLAVAGTRLTALASLLRGALRGVSGVRAMLAMLVVEGVLVPAIAAGIGNRRG